jgi:hypothetical protein
MKRVGALWIFVALLSGVVSATITAHSTNLRDKLGAICGHGHLLALVGGIGIYEVDVDRALAESRYLAGSELAAEPTIVERQTTLPDLIANASARSSGSSESISRSAVRHEVNLLRAQFADEKTWRAALQRSGLSMFSLAQTLKTDLRARKWIGQRIASELNVTENECRQYYDSHAQDFFVPARLRVSHLFLAAPPETPPKVVEAKKATIETLSVRLSGGEDFAILVAQNSEDEATKLNGGDLGYLSATRMPPDFIEVATKLKPGGISKPIRTRLGFHILKLVDAQPPRQRSFDEVQTDIAIDLANQKRATAIKSLDIDLRRSIE